MGEKAVKERAIPQTYGYVNELRDMHLKVPSSCFQILFEEIMSYQPEPMERQLSEKKQEWGIAAICKEEDKTKR